ncbi:acyltransferase family protein [Metabacillus halosaccharovorans]|uniref:Acyltransferase n=1 Tax=Metabacillus halosaccharovorans TaxID=930124 RepID=A0ABT3DH61_9BACI|nr:acyltransferase [Metabacillus halosaccharovorans]MCV9886231.1 acyltransferase [Metabacillus halosaccharovorans]
MSNRISWVDFAKGIGIILVVYGHVLRGIESASMGLSESFFAISDKLVYGFHMPLFFLLSGLFLSKWINKGFKKGVTEKAALLLIPYLIWSLIQGSVNIVLSSFTNQSLTWGDLIINMFMSPFGQFWFLYVLFIMFVIYYIFRKVTTQNSTLIISLILFLIAPFSDVWVLNSVFKNFFFFVVGVNLMNFNLQKVEKCVSNNLYKLSSVVLFIVINYIYLSIELTTFWENLLELPVAIIGINLIIVVSVIVSKIKPFKFIEVLGVLSMAIYLLHILAGSGTRIILNGIFNIDNVAIHIVVGTVLGIAFPVIAYKIIEKFKINKYLFGR